MKIITHVVKHSFHKRDSYLRLLNKIVLGILDLQTSMLLLGRSGTLQPENSAILGGRGQCTVRLVDVRLLGSIQLESGDAHSLTSLDRDINRGLQSLLPWSKENLRHSIIVLHAGMANLFPCPAILGQRLAEAIILASRCLLQ